MHAHAPAGAAVFKTARSTNSTHGRMTGRGGRSCTGTGNHAQRILSPPCFLISPRREIMVRTEGVAPSRACAHRILAPARILFRHIRKNWSIHRDVRPAVCLTKTVRRFLRVGCKMSKRKDSHLRSPSGRRVYSALHLLLCHASKNGGSSGIRTRGLLLMRELR